MLSNVCSILTTWAPTVATQIASISRWPYAPSRFPAPVDQQGFRPLKLTWPRSQPDQVALRFQFGLGCSSRPRQLDSKEWPSSGMTLPCTLSLSTLQGAAIACGCGLARLNESPRANQNRSVRLNSIIQAESPRAKLGPTSRVSAQPQLRRVVWHSIAFSHVAGSARTDGNPDRAPVECEHRRSTSSTRSLRASNRVGVRRFRRSVLPCSWRNFS